MTILDTMLLLCVVGAVTLALGVDLAALFGWLRGRFMRSRGCDGQPPLAAPLTPMAFSRATSLSASKV